MYQNEEICKACGGMCCRMMGCGIAPHEFEDLTSDGLKQRIDEGWISIDLWQNNPANIQDTIGYLYLRTRHVAAPTIADFLKVVNSGTIPEKPPEEIMITSESFLARKVKMSPILDPRGRGICCLLTTSGCSSKVPYQGQMLEPVQGLSDEGTPRCIEHVNRRMMAMLWEPYLPVLRRLAQYYRMG